MSGTGGEADHLHLMHRHGAALDAIARDYREPLRRFFRRRIGRHRDADDLVQEVFLRVARQGEAEAIETRSRYLFAAASNVLRDETRREAVRRNVALGLADTVAGQDQAPCPERILSGRQRVDNVLKSLRDLPERTRMVLMLSRFEEMTYPAIANQLGISVSAVEKHIMKALAHLRKVDTP